MKWKLTWDNYVLYLASIPQAESKPKKEEEVIETRDSDDIF